MAIITRFGGSGGGTPVVDPYPHVWECTVVQSGTIGVVSGVVQLDTYDILHYTMPLGFSTYDLMRGGTTYTTSFLNDGEMYIQWDGNDFVQVSASAGCTLPHVWTSPTYTITGSVLEITGGVDDLRTNDIIVFTLSSGESASVIEYAGVNYLIDSTIDDSQTNYVMFNGSSFELVNPPLADILECNKSSDISLSNGANTVTLNNYDINNTLLAVSTNTAVNSISATQSGSDLIVNIDITGNYSYLRALEFTNGISSTLTYPGPYNGKPDMTIDGGSSAYISATTGKATNFLNSSSTEISVGGTNFIRPNNKARMWYNSDVSNVSSTTNKTFRSMVQFY